MIKVQCIIFDFDGTLMNSFEGHVKVYARMFAHFDIQFDLDLFLKTYSPDWKQTYIAFDLPNEKWDEADKTWVKESESETFFLYNDAKDVIEELHKNFKLGIVTSGSKERVLKDLEDHDIAKYFDSVVTGNDVINQKPHPEGLQKAMEELGVESNNAVYIGDTPIDYQMAKNCNVEFYGLKSPFTNEDGEVKFYDTLTVIKEIIIKKTDNQN